MTWLVFVPKSNKVILVMIVIVVFIINNNNNNDNKFIAYFQYIRALARLVIF